MAPRSSARTHPEPRTRTGRVALLTVALATAFATLLAASACSPKPTATNPEPAQTEQQAAETATATQPAETATPTPAAPTSPEVTELKIEDTKVGKGAAAKAGDTVSVHYTGYLTDGTKFDSSLTRGKPFTLTIGVTSVIEGWTKGIPGMKVGGKRKLTIPPAMGYGAQGAGGVIPPNATLVFDVELLSVN